MFELTYDEIMELKYNARHGDMYAIKVLDDYYDQFDEVPDPMSLDEEIEYKQKLKDGEVYF